MWSTATLRRLVSTRLGILALALGLLQASPVQAQQDLSLDVGQDAATGLFFAGFSNDGPKMIQVSGVYILALDVQGQFLSEGWVEFDEVLKPGAGWVLPIQPMSPYDPDAVAWFGGLCWNAQGDIVALNTYNNSIGIRDITFNLANNALSCSFKNTSDSDINISRIEIKWYRNGQLDHTESIDVNINIPAGRERAWTGRTRHSKLAGDTKVIRAYDVEGNEVGKGSHSVP